jgi:hypothetical protein
MTKKLLAEVTKTTQELFFNAVITYHKKTLDNRMGK